VHRLENREVSLMWKRIRGYPSSMGEKKVREKKKKGSSVNFKTADNPGVGGPKSASFVKERKVKHSGGGGCES